MGGGGGNVHVHLSRAGSATNTDALFINIKSDLGVHPMWH